MAEERLVGDGECVSMAIAVPVYRIIDGEFKHIGYNFVPACQHMKLSSGRFKKGDTATGILQVDFSVPGAREHHK